MSKLNGHFEQADADVVGGEIAEDLRPVAGEV
jgi:hypothetical protein